MPTPRRIFPLASGSVIVVIVLLGAALLVTAYTAYVGVNDASATLVRGQADAFQQTLRAQLAELEAAPTELDLQDLLEEDAAEGLRYLALVEAPGRIQAAAGQARGAGLPPRPALGADFALDPVGGDRVRVLFRSLPRREGGQRLDEGARFRRRLARAGRPLLVLMEFEPLQANRLRATATRNLRLGAAGASALLLVAAALVRQILRREAQARQAERDRRLASLGELSAVLAHEIRNPLASLKGNAQLLAGMLPADEKPRQKADRVVDEAVRLETLTNDLLDFVRTGDLRRAAVNPTALLRDTAAAVNPGIEIEAASAPAAWSLDGERMRQVLTNLLENAVQAGAPVRARVGVEGKSLVFEVRDAGPGIAAEDQERIFEPFFTKRTRGTGLGLAVAKRVVELHQGTIVCANEPGGGARFRVALPQA